MSTIPSLPVPPTKNYLNWPDNSQLDAPIYRFMPFYRLEKMCRSKVNCLVRPRKWDDPFENFLFSTVAIDSDGARVGFGFRDDFYGQCWTDAEETDAMWRIYSHDKDGVRVRCTPRRLLSGLYASQDRFRDIACYIGKVSYLEQDQLVNLLSDPNFVQAAAFDSSGANQSRTLLIKRTAFAHESEVRLTYQRPATDRKAGDKFLYPLDPLAMFDEVVLDPRLKPEEADDFQGRLRTLGVSCEVRHSELYRLPKLYARL